MSRVIAPFARFFDDVGDPLANGFLLFLESNTNNTHKNTYADADQTIPNTNPVQLDAEGRCPNVFGQGIYRVNLYTYNPVTGLPGELLQSFDPVQAEYTFTGAGGNFVEWDDTTTYEVSQIVIRNGAYYRAITSNVAKDPETYPDNWEQITFLRYWNTNVTYLTDDVVVYSGGLYFSLADANQGNVPLSSPAWWSAVGSGTILLNWEEAGSTFQPVSAGYDLGTALNYIGTAYITDFGTFPLTPSAAPTTDYQVANKLYVDDSVGARMRWLGDWVPGTYEINDVVRDDQWTMIAIAQTDDRPAPQPSGDSLWVRDEFSPPDFSETTSSNAVLYVGQRYTFSPAFIAEDVRVYLPLAAIGLSVGVWAVINPTGTYRILNLFPDTVIDETMVSQWVEIPWNQLYVTDGTTVDFIMTLRAPEQATTFTYEWDYVRANGDPASGEIYHQSGGSVDKMRVHENDTGAVDRTSFLDNIGPGSKIYMADQDITWEVLEASKTGDVYTFIIDPAARAATATSNFTFTYYGTSLIPYVYSTDLYLSDSRIRGYFGNTYDPDNATYLNDTGYGIDIKVQNVIVSANWEVVSQAVTSAIPAGDTLGYSEVNGPMAGFRNKIINPFFEIWQRYTGSAITTTGYTADRKNVLRAITGVTSSIDRVTGTTIDGRFVTDYGLSYTFTDDGTADSYALIEEKIESVRSIYGDITMTVVANIPVGNSCSICVRQEHGSGGSPAAQVAYKIADDLVGTGSIETYVRHVNLDEPGALGTDGEDHIKFQIWLTAGSNFTTYTDLGNQTNGTVIFYAWQFEPGPRSTPFEQRHIKDERSLCYRYAYSIDASKTGTGTALFASGLCDSTTYALLVFHAPSPFRINPTISLLSGSYVLVTRPTNQIPTGLTSSGGADMNEIYLTTTGSISLTDGNAAMIGVSSSGIVLFDAEL